MTVTDAGVTYIYVVFRQFVMKIRDLNHASDAGSEMQPLEQSRKA